MTIELLSIDAINKRYLFYEDPRSCKKWLKSKGLFIIKLGKQYFVKQEHFNAVINTISNKDKANQPVKNRSKNNLTPYSEICTELLQLINDV